MHMYRNYGGAFVERKFVHRLLQQDRTLWISITSRNIINIKAGLAQRDVPATKVVAAVQLSHLRSPCLSLLVQ